MKSMNKNMIKMTKKEKIQNKKIYTRTKMAKQIPKRNKMNGRIYVQKGP